MPLSTSEISHECLLHFLHTPSLQDLPNFWLVPVSTVLGVEGLHHRKCIAARVILCHSCIASITILGIPGLAPTEYEWPNLWTLFHLGCDPSLQVCHQTGESKPHAFVSEMLAGWIGRLCIHGRSWTPHSPNHTRITGVLYTVEPLHSTSLEAEAIHVRRHPPTTRNFESVP